MKLILTQEVTGVGAPGDVVEVKDGYGRNYLIPNGYAIPWSRGGEKQISQIKRARQVREVRDLGHAKEIKGQLESLKVTLRAKAGEGGRRAGCGPAADRAARAYQEHRHAFGQRPHSPRGGGRGRADRGRRVARPGSAVFLSTVPRPFVGGSAIP